MLLATDPDSPDFLPPVAQLRQTGPDGEVHGPRPIVWILLHVAGRQPFEAFVFFRGVGHDGSGFKIEHHGFGALGATVESDE